MEEIDLGHQEMARIKFKGESHEITLPSVWEAEKFQEDLDKNKGAEVKVFRMFLTKLGLPESVAKQLQFNQFEKLTNSLLGVVEKK